MKPVLQFAAAAVAVAFVVPQIVSGKLPIASKIDTPQYDRTSAQERTRSPTRPSSEVRRPERNGRATIAMSANGHFMTEAKLNRKRYRVLVDTGASSVALPRSVARKLGIRLGDDDFRHVARTANGETPMAIATLDRVEIGRVLVRDVEAAVLNDDSLDTILLGMSFLGRLKKFEVEKGELVLVR